MMMLVSVLAASTGALLIRLAQQEAPSLVVAAYRLGLGTLFLAPFALTKYRGEIKQLRRKDWMLSVLSGLLLALHFGSWISSLEYTSVASSVVLVSMSPLIVAVLSTLILREPLSRLAWIGLAVALVGSVVVAFSDQIGIGELDLARLLTSGGGKSMLGNVLALAGAVFVSGYLIIGRNLRARLPFIPYTFLVFGTAALVLVLGAFAAGQEFGGYQPMTYLWFAALGLIPQILGHAGFNWALKYLPASFVAIALLGEPIGASLLALLILKEIPTITEVIGGIMILFGIYLAARRKRN